MEKVSVMDYLSMFIPLFTLYAAEAVAHPGATDIAGVVLYIAKTAAGAAKPVAGATVTLYRGVAGAARDGAWDYILTSVTDDRGVFRFKVLDVPQTACFKILADAEGKIPDWKGEWVKGVVVPAEAPPNGFEAGTVRADIIYDPYF